MRIDTRHDEPPPGGTRVERAGDEPALAPAGQLRQRAAELVPEVAARAAEGDAGRTMPADLVERLRAAGLFRLAVPRSLGGHELDPVSIVEIVEQLSWADGSAGWTVLIGNSVLFFAWLAPEVARELLGPEPDAIASGAFAPLGRARPGGDGRLTVSGRWPFNSGCLHAGWYELGIVIMDGDRVALRPDGRPDRRLAFVPAARAEVLDTWRTSGLRGTGSHDVVVEGLVIPARHTATPMVDRPRHPGALLELGFGALTATLMAGFPLGVARRALDELVRLAPHKRRGDAPTTVAHDPHAQLRIGQAEATIQSARAFVLDTVGAAWEAVRRSGRCTEDQCRRIELAARQGMRAATLSLELVGDLAGAAVVYDDHPIGRCLRDLQAARQHVMFSGTGFADYARHVLGVSGEPPRRAD